MKVVEPIAENSPKSTTSAGSEQPGSRRMPELDGLRGLAIALVLVCHYYVILFRIPLEPDSFPYWFNRFLTITWSGVDLFFVLSGFLLGGILMDHLESPNYFKTFYARRAFRILPLYYVLLIPLFLAPYLAVNAAWIKKVTEATISPQLFLFFLQNIEMARINRLGEAWTGVTWSLAIEEQFYLMLPLLIRSVRRRLLPIVMIGLALTAPLIRMLILAWFPPEPDMARDAIRTYVLLPCRWDALGLGVLGAWIIRDPAWRQRLRVRRAAFRCLWGILAAGVLGIGLAAPGLGSTLLNAGGYTWVAAFYCCSLLFVLTTSARLLKGVFTWTPLRQLGTISYAVYLFHFPVQSLTHRFFYLHRAPV
ncbi:MAG: acyltransferase, partial [Verrucomicrobiales bacterium]|nr:acyltransferase [Verrucomicrobiales bacterium]